MDELFERIKTKAKIRPCPFCGNDVGAHKQLIGSFRQFGRLYVPPISNYLIKCDWSECLVNPRAVSSDLTKLIKKWNGGE